MSEHMIPLGDFLATLAERDVKLWVEGGKLCCNAPQHVLTPEFERELSARKQELLNCFSGYGAIRVALFNPLDPGFVRDPYPVFATLRREDPVHKSPLGYWVLTRYKHVRAALENRDLGNEPSPYAWMNRRYSHRYIAADIANYIVPFMEGPAHALARRLIAKAFRDHVKRSAPGIPHIAQRLLRSRRADGEMDIIADFARPLASTVIGRMLGFPPDDHRRLSEWSDWFMRLLCPIPSEDIRHGTERALADFRSHCAQFIDERKASPRNDLASAMLQAHEGQIKLTDRQVVDSCMLIFADGVENVAASVGNTVASLLQNPGELKRLRSQPQLMASAIDECLRYESPAQFIGRVATRDAEIGGKTIRKNEAVLLILASANRDAEQFPEPDRLDIARADNQHLSFGRGRHGCIGASLTRLELGFALAAILDELPGVRLKEPLLQWRPRIGHRWLEKLPVAFDSHSVKSSPRLRAPRHSSI